MKKQLKSIASKIPVIGKMIHNHFLLTENACYPPGHFYSPIIEVDAVKRDAGRIWSNRSQQQVPAVALNTEVQLEFLKRIVSFYGELPFQDNPSASHRYYFANPYYGYTDAITLFGMMRSLNPNRIIEIGSGFSSALMLDTNELFFNGSINLTFIEPYPDRLNSLLRSSDRQKVKIFEQEVQKVDYSVFESLEAGDILFVDSSHVSKTGSDLNHILFEIIPRLNTGVYIHFHDIFHPFEYPEKWVYAGRNWNEDYLLRAFLMYNQAFSICFFADYLHLHHADAFKDAPMMRKNTGANFWIQKL